MDFTMLKTHTQKEHLLIEVRKYLKTMLLECTMKSNKTHNYWSLLGEPEKLCHFVGQSQEQGFHKLRSPTIGTTTFLRLLSKGKSLMSHGAKKYTEHKIFNFLEFIYALNLISYR